MKSIYHSDTLRDVPPSFYIHTGCNFLMHSSYRTVPYSHPLYGKKQNGESLMFYGKGLAIIGRAKKVFNDTPMHGEYSDIFALNNEYGRIWKSYFFQWSLEIKK